MATRNPPMSEKRLREFVSEYAPEFQDWTFVDGTRFIRIEGPVAQVIGFEALRSGAYRPANAVRILVAPNSALLHQFLDIKHREIFAIEHDGKVDQIVKAMEEQFTPAIRSALVSDEVLQLCEHSAIERVNDAYALSALNAFCGNRERAIEWLDVLSQLTEPRQSKLFGWERKYMDFGIELRSQMERQNGHNFLEDKLKAEQTRILS